jgi:hypothetical protein
MQTSLFSLEKKLSKACLYEPVVRATLSFMMAQKSRDQKLVEAYPTNVRLRKHSVQIPASFSILRTAVQKARTIELIEWQWNTGVAAQEVF